MREEQGPIRLNKYLSEAGLCSRREADRMIEQGRVTVDGERALQGMRVLPSQRIMADGREVFLEEERIILAVNKPAGIVCTSARHSGEENIVDFVNYPKRIYPVGRLDKNSEGLILMTNQGDIVNTILKASNYHEKEYLVTVNKPVTPEFLRAMREGVPILGTVTRPCIVEKEGKRSFRIILTQGLNRQIRRMCEYLGYRVENLIRVRIMNICLGDLASGSYRPLTQEEVKGLYKLDGSDGGAEKEKEKRDESSGSRGESRGTSCKNRVSQ